MDKGKLAIHVCDAIEWILPRAIIEGPIDHLFVRVRYEDWRSVLIAMDKYEKAGIINKEPHQ